MAQQGDVTQQTLDDLLSKKHNLERRIPAPDHELLEEYAQVIKEIDELERDSIKVSITRRGGRVFLGGHIFISKKRLVSILLLFATIIASLIWLTTEQSNLEPFVVLLSAGATLLAFLTD